MFCTVLLAWYQALGGRYLLLSTAVDGDSLVEALRRLHSIKPLEKEGRREKLELKFSRGCSPF